MDRNESIDDEAIFKRLETSFVLEQVDLMRRLEDRRQAVSGLRLQIYTCAAKKTEMARELRDVEAEVARMSAHAVRLRAHVERLKKVASHSEEGIKTLERMLVKEKQQGDRKSEELEEILENARTVLERYCVHYESLAPAIEIRLLKSKLDEAKQQLITGGVTLAKKKQKVAQLIARAPDARWKRITKQVIHLAGLKCETRHIANKIQAIEEGADDNSVSTNEFTHEATNIRCDSDVQVEEVAATEMTVTSETFAASVEPLMMTNDVEPQQKQVHHRQPYEYANASVTNHLEPQIQIGKHSKDAAPMTPSRLKPPILVVPLRRSQISKPVNDDDVQIVYSHNHRAPMESDDANENFKAPVPMASYQRPAEFQSVQKTPSPPQQHTADANQFGYFYGTSNMENISESMPFGITLSAGRNRADSVFNFFNSPQQSNNNSSNASNQSDNFAFAFNRFDGSPCANKDGYNRMF